MKVKSKAKEKATLYNRQTWGRLDENTKVKILKEIQGGLIGQREASRRYGIPRTTIILWQRKVNLVNLLNSQNSQTVTGITASQESKILLKKVQELTKALEHERLKSVALETMIEVAESDLHIKIRKKRGTKQS